MNLNKQEKSVPLWNGVSTISFSLTNLAKTPEMKQLLITQNRHHTEDNKTGSKGNILRLETTMSQTITSNASLMIESQNSMNIGTKGLKRIVESSLIHLFIDNNSVLFDIILDKWQSSHINLDNKINISSFNNNENLLELIEKRFGNGQNERNLIAWLAILHKYGNSKELAKNIPDMIVNELIARKKFSLIYKLLSFKYHKQDWINKALFKKIFDRFRSLKKDSAHIILLLTILDTIAIDKSLDDFAIKRDKLASIKDFCDYDIRRASDEITVESIKKFTVNVDRNESESEDDFENDMELLKKSLQRKKPAKVPENDDEDEWQIKDADLGLLDKKWQCSVCTFHNDMTSVSCEICNVGQRPTGDELRKLLLNNDKDGGGNNGGNGDGGGDAVKKSVRFVEEEKKTDNLIETMNKAVETKLEATLKKNNDDLLTIGELRSMVEALSLVNRFDTSKIPDITDAINEMVNELTSPNDHDNNNDNDIDGDTAVTTGDMNSENLIIPKAKTLTILENLSHIDIGDSGVKVEEAITRSKSIKQLADESDDKTDDKTDKTEDKAEDKTEDEKDDKAELKIDDVVEEKVDEKGDAQDVESYAKMVEAGQTVKSLKNQIDKTLERIQDMIVKDSDNDSQTDDDDEQETKKENSNDESVGDIGCGVIINDSELCKIVSQCSDLFAFELLFKKYKILINWTSDDRYKCLTKVFEHKHNAFILQLLFDSKNLQIKRLSQSGVSVVLSRSNSIELLKLLFGKSKSIQINPKNHLKTIIKSANNIQVLDTILSYPKQLKIFKGIAVKNSDISEIFQQQNYYQFLSFLIDKCVCKLEWVEYHDGPFENLMNLYGKKVNLNDMEKLLTLLKKSNNLPAVYGSMDIRGMHYIYVVSVFLFAWKR